MVLRTVGVGVQVGVPSGKVLWPERVAGAKPKETEPIEEWEGLWMATA